MKIIWNPSKKQINNNNNKLEIKKKKKKTFFSFAKNVQRTTNRRELNN